MKGIPGIPYHVFREAVMKSRGAHIPFIHSCACVVCRCKAQSAGYHGSMSVYSTSRAQGEWTSIWYSNKRAIIAIYLWMLWSLSLFIISIPKDLQV